ncbi:MAG TPA: hypothetical protein VF244_02800 [Acidimicrobiales bacterium]
MAKTARLVAMTDEMWDQVGGAARAAGCSRAEVVRRAVAATLQGGGGVGVGRAQPKPPKREALPPAAEVYLPPPPVVPCAHPKTTFVGYGRTCDTCGAIVR